MSFNRQSAHSIAIAKNGDYLVGGERYLDPWIMRLDTLGNVKWSTWYYDSTRDRSILSGSGTINCVRETKRGTIICAVGDEYPDNGGLALHNYATYMEFTADGEITTGNEWDGVTGYNAGGFSIEETSTGYYIIAGNQSVFYLDTNGTVVWRKNYTFSLPGVGTVTNNVSRVKMLRDGSLMVAGQAYEGNCWTNWQKFYYDAWHSPISYAYGANESWDTAGVQGRDDIIYDFTQLINGNLVFVGTRGDRNGPAPVWAFVTDSTGKQLLMDKQFCMPRSDGTCGNTFPFSVVATDDTGFTVAGKGTFDTTSGWNGFTAHFKPAPVVITIKRSFDSYPNFNLQIVMLDKKVFFTIDGNDCSLVDEISIYGVNGKKVATAQPAGVNKLAWDRRGSAAGVYIYCMKTGGKALAGRILLK